METGERAVRTYDKILIATGASAFAPPVPGLEPECRFLMRTHEDAARLREALEDGQVKSAVVVGASMVGIKVAELLAARESGRCWPIWRGTSSRWPLTRRGGGDRPPGGEKRYPSGSGGPSTTWSKRAFAGGGTQQFAVMTDGERIQADIAVLCIGTRANTGVVDAGEIETSRAILVNERMETSAEGIYAAGDCCAGNNIQSGERQIIGLWANANCQGTVAGTNMAGGEAAFRGNILHNITHFMDMDFIGFGDNRIAGETLTFGSLDRGLYIKAVCRDGRLAGINILDSYPISGIIKTTCSACLRTRTAALRPSGRDAGEGRASGRIYRTIGGCSTWKPGKNC